MDKGHGSVLMFCSSPITAARCGVLLGVYCSAADSADTQCMTADYCRVSTVIYSRYGFVTEQWTLREHQPRRLVAVNTPRRSPWNTRSRTRPSSFTSKSTCYWARMWQTQKMSICRQSVCTGEWHFRSKMSVLGPLMGSIIDNKILFRPLKNNSLVKISTLHPLSELSLGNISYKCDFCHTLVQGETVISQVNA